MSSQSDPITGRRVVDPSVYSVEFKPRAGGRRVVGVVTLLGLGASAYLGWVAYQQRSTFSYAIVATVFVLILVLWAVWASTPVTHLHVHGGVLEVRRGGKTSRFDLTSHYTQLRVEGKPTSSRWRVLIDRPTDVPFIIDRSMVDPRAFMKVLRAYHRVD